MKNNNSTDNQGWLKFLCDFLPLIVFFSIYKWYTADNPLIVATIGLLITTVIALAINYWVAKEIAVMPLFSAIILGLFGGMTIFSGNEIFIKMKPTLLNILFAMVLFFGYFSKKPFLKYLFGSKVSLSERSWLILSWRWGVFFIFLALLNELIWRNFPTDFWVKFKVFGILPISILFALTQMPYMIKEMNKLELQDNASS